MARCAPSNSPSLKISSSAWMISFPVQAATPPKPTPGKRILVIPSMHHFLLLFVRRGEGEVETTDNPNVPITKIVRPTFFPSGIPAAVEKKPHSLIPSFLTFSIGNPFFVLLNCHTPLPNGYRRKPYNCGYDDRECRKDFQSSKTLVDSL